MRKSLVLATMILATGWAQQHWPVTISKAASGSGK
jgi:hypothetical protein